MAKFDAISSKVEDEVETEEADEEEEKEKEKEKEKESEKEGGDKGVGEEGGAGETKTDTGADTVVEGEGEGEGEGDGAANAGEGDPNEGTASNLAAPISLPRIVKTKRTRMVPPRWVIIRNFDQAAPAHQVSERLPFPIVPAFRKIFSIYSS